MLIADIWELEVRRVLGYPTIRQPSFVRPLVRTFSSPGPHNPTLITAFVSYHLCLPHLPQERLEGGAECGRRTGLTYAGANERGPSKGSVKSRANSTTVEECSTVCHGGSPLADDCP